MRRHASNLDVACVTLIVAWLLALPALSMAQSTAVLRTPWGDPDLQGIWDQTTGTPLERAADVADREFLNEEEAARRETQRFQAFDSAPRAGSPGNYGSQWRDGSRNAIDRTSLIVDPPDGRMPALTPAARTTRETRAANRRDHPADSWLDRGLWERCLTRGVPRVPNNYNSNMLILQTPTTVVILNEMINETRVIYLDGRPHTSMNIRLWNGDSRGSWNGDTLIVESTNFDDDQIFQGFGVGNLRLIERFRRVGPGQIDYQMTLIDPETYTRRWTVVLPMTKTKGPIFEYACHEGNLGMKGILAGHRIEEARQ